MLSGRPNTRAARYGSRNLCSLLCYTVLSATSHADSFRAMVSHELELVRGISRMERELRTFEWQCQDQLGTRLEHASQMHSALAQVVVFDLRHDGWTGLGETLPRVALLLRLADALGRAGFVWMDTCADADGPARPDAPAGCQFDLGEHFRGLSGMAYQWNHRLRRSLERAHPDGELALRFTCTRFEPGKLQVDMCANGTWTTPDGEPQGHSYGDAFSLLKNLTHPWARVELTHMNDLQAEALLLKPGGGASRCELAALTRPSAALLREIRPYSRRMSEWAGVAALSARTGFADHASLFPDLQPTVDLGGDELMRRLEDELMRQCPPGVRPVWRELPRGERPCVNWQTNAADPTFSPDAVAAARCRGEEFANVSLPGGTADRGPFESYAECAGAAARAVAMHPTSWGVLLVSDAPALKYAMRTSPLGVAGHVMVTPTAWGHRRYAAGDARRVHVLAALDLYLLGLADVIMVMFSSAFPSLARARSFLYRNPPEGAHVMDYGFEMWFWGGREREAGARGMVNVSVVQLLAVDGS